MIDLTDYGWNEAFVPAVLAGADTKPMLTDVASLAKAQPEATYIELMKLIYGVDQASIIPLDPTLSEVRYMDKTATGTATRADGKTTTMSFENTPERGWLIVD